MVQLQHLVLVPWRGWGECPVWSQTRITGKTLPLLPSPRPWGHHAVLIFLCGKPTLGHEGSGNVRGSLNAHTTRYGLFHTGPKPRVSLADWPKPRHGMRANRTSMDFKHCMRTRRKASTFSQEVVMFRIIWSGVQGVRRLRGCRGCYISYRSLALSLCLSVSLSLSVSPSLSLSLILSSSFFFSFSFS